ncbi:MAG: trehalase family glycosidase [Anaerolineales bacterium]
MTSREKLVQQAKEVLDGNWLGYATKPAPRLYPHQWSWDSAFIAMAYAHYNTLRAMQEMRSLFQGQWQNGMLPHILFNQEAGDYSPGPEFWQIDRSPHAPKGVVTSGIIQPPVHATSVLHIALQDPDKDRSLAFLREMFPKLKSWHAYLYNERDLEQDGLISIRHPWESGQDNSPIWDRALSKIKLVNGMVPAYHRVDTNLVDVTERPTMAEYDRYAYLVKIFYENDYDEARIFQSSPFIIQDVLFNSLLVQANRDLSTIAHLVGEDSRIFEQWAFQTSNAMNEKLWDPTHSIYFDFDLVSGQAIHAHVAAGFSPLYAGIPTTKQAELIRANLNTYGFCRLNEVCWAVPSYDKMEPGYSPSRYWRGPVWININWVLHHGLSRYGFQAYSEYVKHAIIKLPSEFGFFEYFDAETGEGHGSESFSWTAARLLDLLLEEEQYL